MMEGRDWLNLHYSIKERRQGLSNTGNNRVALRQESGKTTLKGGFVNDMVIYMKRTTINQQTSCTGYKDTYCQSNWLYNKWCVLHVQEVGKCSNQWKLQHFCTCWCAVCRCLVCQQFDVWWSHLSPRMCFQCRQTCPRTLCHQNTCEAASNTKKGLKLRGWCLYFSF